MPIAGALCWLIMVGDGWALPDCMNNRTRPLGRKAVSAEQRLNDVPRDTAAPPASLHGVVLGHRLALSVEEAGPLLGISRDLAYDLVACGDLPSVRLGRRIVVPRRALEETLARMVRPAVDDGPGRACRGRS
jgi:excisionase family DNA binding protein